MSWSQRIGIVAGLVAIVVVLFHQSFNPTMVLFSSDGPLGIMAAKDLQLPAGFTGYWFDSNWLGASLGIASPSFMFMMMWLLTPVMAAKFLAPIFVLVAGLAATFCFRVLGFRPMVCLLAGIAAELNSNFFSNACWGVGTRGSALAAAFLAIAGIWSARRSYPWLKLVLAGFATGMSVMEGADNGMLFSLFIAAFAFYLALIGEGSRMKRIIHGLTTVAVVAVCALVIAFVSIKGLVGTQIKGKTNMGQDTASKGRRWTEATMWSLPKKELLRVIIPGVFGYRMDTPEGGEYWGGVGSDPQIPEIKAQLKNPDPQVQQQALNYLRNTQWRSSGAGEYAGVLVVLVGVWGLVRSFSRTAQTFSPLEKKLIWFWAAMFIVAACFGWGRHAPFYQFFYALPYMSTIRNPMKFMHPGHMTLMILFAYGLEGLAREYLDTARSAAKTAASRAQGWWASATRWEKLWTFSCIAVIALSALSWMVYSSTRSDLVKYMTENAIGARAEPADVAKFSIREVGYFVLVLTVCVGALLAIQAGMFRGARAVWAGVLLGIILFGDFARANAPWIQYYDYKIRYASNPVLDVLKDKPWEHRVTMPPFQFGQQFDMFRGFYQGEWVQHQLQYFNIQTLDVTQDPRPPLEKSQYISATTRTNYARYWQLTNTRYIFGVPGAVDAFNQQLDPVLKRFRQVMAFTLYPRPGTSAAGVQTNATGPFALIDFTGALPRAKLYSRWQVSTNDTETLSTLGAPSFKPEELVLVNDDIPAPSSVVAPAEGSAEYKNYEPKKFEIRTSSTAPSMLLVNDHTDPDWHVTVDGKPERVLRANFVIRAVQVPAGQHTVVWHYRPDLTAAYVSWSAFILALVLCGAVTVLTRRPVAVARKA